MRILVVSQCYWPDQFHVTDICEAFVERGHEVTVLTVLPNCPSDHVPDVYRRGRCRRQERSGVRIERVPLVAMPGNPVRLALNHRAFAFNAWRRGPGIGDGLNAVYVCGMSPVMQTISALRYRRLFGAPVLLYCLDLWPESMKAVLGDRLPQLVAVYGRVSGVIYRGVDEIAVQSPSFLDEVMELPRLIHVNGDPVYRAAKLVCNVVFCSLALVVHAIPIGVLAFKIFHEAFKERIHGLEQHLAVRPILIGLVCAEGGYELLPKEKALLDIKYLENRGFVLDFSLIWRRLRTMATGEGVR